MKKVKILCTCIILSGIGLFIISYLFVPASEPVFGLCIGLSSAMFILGLGYLLNVLVLSAGNIQNNRSLQEIELKSYVKEKAGYLVCKIMNILLCIFLLILNELGCDLIIMILGISLVMIQFVLDLLFQIILLNRKNKE